MEGQCGGRGMRTKRERGRFHLHESLLLSNELLLQVINYVLQFILTLLRNTPTVVQMLIDMWEMHQSDPMVEVIDWSTQSEEELKIKMEFFEIFVKRVKWFHYGILNIYTFIKGDKVWNKPKSSFKETQEQHTEMMEKKSLLPWTYLFWPPPPLYFHLSPSLRPSASVFTPVSFLSSLFLFPCLTHLHLILQVLLQFLMSFSLFHVVFQSCGMMKKTLLSSSLSYFSLSVSFPPSVSGSVEVYFLYAVMSLCLCYHWLKLRLNLDPEVQHLQQDGWAAAGGGVRGGEGEGGGAGGSHWEWKNSSVLQGVSFFPANKV